MGKKRNIYPTQERLKELFDYDLRLGRLRRRVGNTKAHCLVSNNADSNYAKVRVDGTQYSVHHIVYIWHFGAMAEGSVIDHRDGDRSNNRVENLRATTQALNCRNQKRRSTNTSGATGVYWLKDSSKWRARFRVDGRYIYAGDHQDFDAAKTAVERARAQHGFTARHGSAA